MLVTTREISLSFASHDFFPCEDPAKITIGLCYTHDPKRPVLSSDRLIINPADADTVDIDHIVIYGEDGVPFHFPFLADLIPDSLINEFRQQIAEDTAGGFNG